MSYEKLKYREVFRATVNGKEYVFTCYTQYCGTHVRELCCEGFSDTTESKWIKRDIIGKDIWLNRPWYCFRYEKALRQGIEKMPKQDQAKLKAILIDKTEQDEKEKADAEIQAFQALYEKTSPEFKERTEHSNIIMQDDSDMRAVKGLMLLDMIMNN